MTRPAEPPIAGYSRAMYANWLWHRPLRLLVDAGEGLQLALGTSVFTPATVAITHGHSDHVLGLPGFAAARRFGKGAVTRPYDVLYPAGARGVEGMQRLLEDIWRGVDFPITWREMRDGAEHRLSPQHVLQAFAVAHVAGEPALGYRVLETRRRLKPAYAALPSAEIERLARDGRRDALMEPYHHVVFAHSGDAMPIDPDLARGADLLVHDATFLSTDDRREPIHATTGEALAVARDAGVAALVLHHLSIRYDRAEALPRLRAQLAESGFAGDCYWLDEGTITRL
ncbi:MAG: MBL fold metallo-hydrolase [Acidobacteriota bacterium]